MQDRLLGLYVKIEHKCHRRGKGKGTSRLTETLIRTRLEPTRFTISEMAPDWHEQIILQRSSLLPAEVNTWTRGAECRHTTA